MTIPLRLLVISANPDFNRNVRRILSAGEWTLSEAMDIQSATRFLCRESVPVVLCESGLPDGNWRDMLSHMAPLIGAPRLIVTSPQPDERLWAEVLNMGGYDVLAQPLEADELRRVADSAQRDWVREHAPRPAVLHAVARA
jgi:DNA-binding NtrC family response regulator